MSKGGAKILHFDVETAPILAYVWGLFNQNIGLSQIKRDGYMLSYSAMWDDSDDVYYDALPYHPDIYSKDNTDATGILTTLWELLDEADIVVAHNAKRFDVAKVDGYFLQYGLKPPSPFKIVDTLTAARGRFRLTSNKLDWIAGLLGIGHKNKMDFDDWKGCMEGNKKSWDKMVKYNIMDVQLLKKVYRKLRPWMKNHPNLALYEEDSGALQCPRCLSSKLKPNGYAFTAVGKYRRFVCKSCGYSGKMSKMENTKEERALLLRNIAQ